MPRQTPAQLAKPLLDLYAVCYKEKYGKAPVLNRHRDKWGFVDMLEDLDFEQCKELIEYYFRTTRPGHPLVGLFNNYDSLWKTKIDLDEDRRKKKELLAATKAKVKEMKCQQKSN